METSNERERGRERKEIELKEKSMKKGKWYRVSPTFPHSLIMDPVIFENIYKKNRNFIEARKKKNSSKPLLDETQKKKKKEMYSQETTLHKIFINACFVSSHILE